MNKTTIEAGHFYLYEDEKGEPPGFLNEQYLGVQLAFQIAQESGCEAEFLLFIDDYHGNPDLDRDWQDEDIQHTLLQHPDAQPAYQAFQEQGIEPLLVSELAVTSAAAHLLHLLIKKGVVAKGNKNLLSDYGNVSLVTKDNQPTCSLIDSALYLKKIGVTQDQSTVTVLPIRYKPQQEQVKQILRAFGVAHPPITVVYHDDQGVVLEHADWSQEVV